MNDERPNILVLEDTRTVQNYIRDVLRSLDHPHELLLARRVDEAVKLAEQHRIDLFVVDIGLPDGDGIDFLVAMSAVHPEARALIITSTPSEAYRDRARQLGVLNFLPKPLQRKPLIDAVMRLLLPGGTINGAAEAVGFEGCIGGLSPADVIQLKCLRQATGVIEFSHDEGYGMVWFEGGEITHAESEGSLGHITGIGAFMAIMTWRSGTVREVPQPPPAARTIHKSWQALLMDATPMDAMT